MHILSLCLLAAFRIQPAFLKNRKKKCVEELSSPIKKYENVCCFPTVRVAQTESWRVRGGRGGGKGGYRNRERDFDGHYNHPIRDSKFQVREETERSFSNYQREGGGETTVMIREEGVRQYNDSGSSRGRDRGRDRYRDRGGGRGFGFSGDGEESENPRYREYDRRSGTGRGYPSFYRKHLK